MAGWMLTGVERSAQLIHRQLAALENESPDAARISVRDVTVGCLPALPMDELV